MGNLWSIRVVDSGGMSETTITQNAELEERRAQRAALKSRHVQSLTKLMEERTDLRGVHALADFVDDAVRWTA